MIIFSTKIFAQRSNKKGILEIFSNVKGPVEAKTGCMSTRIYRVHTNEDLIVYQEVWENKKSLEKHVRSNLFKKIMVDTISEISCPGNPIKA